MSQKSSTNREVATQIKNPELVRQRREQIVDAAVQLFIQNGYHKTTTRMLAKASGFSIGSLYEYVSSKEDVLYLVCIAIHTEVERGVEEALARSTRGREALAEVIHEYFRVCHRMSDHILLMYQVTHFLPDKWQKKVLENELRITDIFVKAVTQMTHTKEFPFLDEKTIEMVAHNISVLGQMWAFRRWYFARHFTIESYIEYQTDFILGILTGKNTGNML